jgi:hypothetical protein
VAERFVIPDDLARALRPSRPEQADRLTDDQDGLAWWSGFVGAFERSPAFAEREGLADDGAEPAVGTGAGS